MTNKIVAVLGIIFFTILILFCGGYVVVFFLHNLPWSINNLISLVVCIGFVVLLAKAELECIKILKN